MFDKTCGDVPMRSFRLRVLSFSAIAALAVSPALWPAFAAEPDANTEPSVQAAAKEAKEDPQVTGSIGPVRTRFLSLGVGKSAVVDLPREAKDVLVADPKIANAVIRSAQRAYIIGSAVGQTNVVFFDAAGNQISSYDIAIKRDLNGIRAALRSIPGVQIEGVGDGVILTGSVSSPIEAQQAGDVAAKLVGSAEKVVNSIVVRGRDQVMLKVHVAEVHRDIVKQMGVDISASMNYGTAVVNFNNQNPFTAFGRPLVAQNGFQAASILKGVPQPGHHARDGERRRRAYIGRTNWRQSPGAATLSGIEFPIPAGYSCDPVTRRSARRRSYKGRHLLNFTPVVMSEGRISLRVMTEVSELSSENALTLNQNGSSLTVPSIRTRRADSTLEIPSGGSMAMAGLIQQQTRQAVNGLPGLDQLPILGGLFRSQDFVNNETELMVLVTPYVVRAVAQKDLSRPDDGFAPANDSQSTLLARINRIYGVAARVETGAGHPGYFGFIID